MYLNSGEGFDVEFRQSFDVVDEAFEVGDAEAFFRLNSDLEVMRHTGEPLCESIEAARVAVRQQPGALAAQLQLRETMEGGWTRRQRDRGLADGYIESPEPAGRALGARQRQRGAQS